jgi:hypothetical protein
MARIGKKVNPEDPIYLLDKKRGVFNVPIVGGGSLVVRNLKYINRDAFDANYFEIEVDGNKYRLNRDELEEGLRYV